MWNTRRAGAWLAAGLALLLACRSGEPGEDPRRPDRSGDGWREAIAAWRFPAPIPDVELTDQTGRRFRLAELARGHVLVGFIYTRCPVARACPMTTEKMRAVQSAWRDRVARGQAEGRSLRLLSLTLDPVYDTPERLSAFARERGLAPDWTLATGPAELMASGLPSLFNVLALPGEPGQLDHTVKVALLSPGLRIAKEWPDNEFSVEDVIRAILAPAPPAPVPQGPE